VELVAVRSQQQASSALSVQHGTQFVPRNFKLRGGACVAELIQPRELQQDIQAADEGARCGGFSVRGHASLAIPSGFFAGLATLTPLLVRRNHPAFSLWPIH